MGTPAGRMPRTEPVSYLTSLLTTRLDLLGPTPNRSRPARPGRSLSPDLHGPGDHPGLCVARTISRPETPQRLRRAGRLDPPGDLLALLPFHHGDFVLPLQVQPELRRVAEIAA